MQDYHSLIPTLVVSDVRTIIYYAPIAIPQQEWSIFQDMNFIQLSEVLKFLAGLVRLSAFRRHPRGPKKVKQKRNFLKQQPHVSTAKLLAQAKKGKQTP